MDWHEREAQQYRDFQRRVALSDASPTEFREGFLRGYLQAYKDMDEYACTVQQAKEAHGRVLEEGRTGAPLEDVEGW